MVAAHPHIDPTGPAWADPVHDRAGNMTTVPRPSNPSNYYTCKYDAWHRLVETVWGILADGEYEYDGLNRRTIESPKLLMRLHRHFFWNASWQNLEVRTTYTADAQPESLSVLHQYVWSARYIDAPVLRDKPGSGERLYYLNDANFNVTTLVDTSGDALEHYQYDPYGKVTVLNGGAPDSDGDEWTADPNNFSDVANEYFYTGRKRDLKTLLYYYRRRYYHAELGRFFSRDPISYFGGLNLYEYVGDSPLGRVDPMGLEWRWDDFVGHYYGQTGETVDLADVGLLGVFARARSVRAAVYSFTREKLFQEAKGLLDVLNCHSATSLQFSVSDHTKTDVTSEIFVVGHSTFQRAAACTLWVHRCCCCPPRNGTWRPFEYRLLCNVVFYIRDWFRDPLDIGIEPGGTPYRINAEFRLKFGRSIYYLPNPCDTRSPEMMGHMGFGKTFGEDVQFPNRRCMRWFPDWGDGYLGYELPTRNP